MLYWNDMVLGRGSLNSEFLTADVATVILLFKYVEPLLSSE